MNKKSLVNFKTNRPESMPYGRLIYYFLMLPGLYLYGIMIYLNVSGNQFYYLGPCPLFDMTGIECPACGATRAICSILTLDFALAIKYNIVFFVLFFICAVIYVYNLYCIITHNRWINFNAKWFYLVLAVLIIFAIIRNFPFFPIHLKDLPAHSNFNALI